MEALFWWEARAQAQSDRWTDSSDRWTERSLNSYLSRFRLFDSPFNGEEEEKSKRKGSSSVNGWAIEWSTCNTAFRSPLSTLLACNYIGNDLPIAFLSPPATARKASRFILCSPLFYCLFFKSKVRHCTIITLQSISPSSFWKKKWMCSYIKVIRSKN